MLNLLLLFFYTSALCVGPPWYMEEGRKREMEGKYLEALSFYKKAVELNPFYVKAFEGMGRCYLGLKLLKEAESSFKKVVLIQPLSAWGHYWLAIVAWRQQKRKEAEDYFKKAKELLPKNPLILCKFAKFYAEQNLFDKARSLYAQSIRADPEFVESYIGMGNLYLRKNPEVALFYLKKAKRLNGPSAEIALLLATLFEERGWRTIAIAELEEASKKESKHLPLLKRLASLYQKETLYRKAIRTYKRMLKIKKEPTFFFNLGELYRRLKKGRRALEHFSSAFLMDPYDESSLYRASLLCLKLEGIGSKRRAKYARVHKELADRYFADKKYTLAHHHYKMASLLLPQDEQIRLKRVNLLIERGAVKEAIKQLRILSDLAPGKREYKERLEQLYYRRKESIEKKHMIKAPFILHRSVMMNVEEEGERLGFGQVFYERLSQMLRMAPYIKIGRVSDYVLAKKRGAEFFLTLFVQEGEEVKVDVEFWDLKSLKEEKISFSAKGRWCMNRCLYTLLSFMRERILPKGYIKKVDEPTLTAIAGIGYLQGAKEGAKIKIWRKEKLLGEAQIIKVDEDVCMLHVPAPLIKEVRVGDLAQLIKG